MIYFISGHLDLTYQEFLDHYTQPLRAAIAEWHSEFIVGDANGADSMAQEFLACNIMTIYPHSRLVTVYHMFNFPRNNHGFEIIGGFQSDKERDEFMTKHSDADIAWVRPGREKSGTAKNLIRRRLSNVNI